MSNAPERIWANKSTKGQCVVSFSTPSEEYAIEYVRADLIEYQAARIAELEARIEKVIAACDNLDERKIDAGYGIDRAWARTALKGQTHD